MRLLGCRRHARIGYVVPYTYTLYHTYTHARVPVSASSVAREGSSSLVARAAASMLGGVLGPVAVGDRCGFLMGEGGMDAYTYVHI